MTTINATTSETVFGLCAWSNPAPGVWEAETSPGPNGRPRFEAVALADLDQPGAWWWSLYHPASPEPDAELIALATGRGHTLADAQRQAETAAQRWDLQPWDLDPLGEATPWSLVTCSECGTAYSVTELAANDGRCADPEPVPFCDSMFFDGHHSAELIRTAFR